MAAEDSKSIQELLSLPILLADRTIKSAREAEFFKLETSELARQVTLLAELLRTAARIASGAAVYDRPIRRVSVDVTKTLESALALAHKCRRKRAAVLHVLAITTAADFKKLSTLLESSIADIRWCLSILNHDINHSPINLSLPPIATTEPNLAWIWPYIAAVYAGRADAARELANWARDNDHNKKIIMEENGIPPLLNMLNNSGNVDAQAAAALYNLADSPAGVKRIVAATGVQIIVKALSEVPIFVRITLVNLVSRMSEGNAQVQEEFGRENVTRLLVAFLGMDIDLEEFNEVNYVKPLVSSLHSLVEINKEMMMMGNRHVNSRNEKEKEADSAEIRSTLMLSCANALWKLARENSKKIAEKKALLVLGKTIEKESGELRMNCLMVVMELAAVAETNSDLKRAAFKPNSAPAKLILDQLLRVINNESNALLVIPAIKAIGCLASMFSAKEKQIVKSLVGWLGLMRNSDIACEAAKALCKFVRCDNYNCKEHAKAIIEFGGVAKVMEMLRSKERGHLHELVLLCNLAINAGNSKALEEARALSVVEGALMHVVAQNPALKELFTKAIHQLTIYQSGHHA